MASNLSTIKLIKSDPAEELPELDEETKALLTSGVPIDKFRGLTFYSPTTAHPSVCCTP